MNGNGGRRLLSAAGLLAGGLLLTGCGNAAPQADSTSGHAVTVNGYDNMKFDPPTITVKAGETITIQFANKGILPHDLITQGADRNATLVNLSAGKMHRGAFQATKPGEYAFVCVQPGHREAGMVGKVVVTG